MKESNILKFMKPIGILEKEKEEARLYIDGSLHNLDDAMNGVLQALEDTGEVLGEEAMVDPYYLLDAISRVYMAFQHDPEKYESVQSMHFICEYLEMMEETEGEDEQP